MAALRSLVAFLIAIAPLILAADEPQILDIPVTELGRSYRLIGKLHAPLGKAITIQGQVIGGHFKSFESGPNLRASMIDGRASQENIQILLIGMPSEQFKPGATYEIRGYEEFQYVGTHPEVYAAGPPIQTRTRYLQNQFHVIKAKEILPIQHSPIQFEGRRALLNGLAKNRGGQAVMEGENWHVIVDSSREWNSDMLGKSVETFGYYESTAEKSSFSLVNGIWRLVKLADQVGRQVELRGRLLSMNGIWWLDYRGTQLYVEDLTLLPGWTPQLHGESVVIRGRLEVDVLPRIDQISLKSPRDLSKHFIVRRASWEHISDLLLPELPAD